MNQIELLRDVQILTRAEEIKRSDHGSSINPELLAMHKILPGLNPHQVDFLKKRMAFDVVHFSEPRIREADYPQWRVIMGEVKEYLPDVPRSIRPMPRGWRRVFSDVLRLYGNPDGDE